ncbi:hypothetical protein ATN79_44685 [Paraburkholderia caribensis]|nr:hypothetical protein ATN79_44685 [Paraburkholderia caribensis]
MPTILGKTCKCLEMRTSLSYGSDTQPLERVFLARGVRTEFSYARRRHSSAVRNFFEIIEFEVQRYGTDHRQVCRPRIVIDHTDYRVSDLFDGISRHSKELDTVV